MAVVYISMRRRGLYLDEDVGAYKLTFDYLRSQAADTTASLRLVTRALQELSGIAASPAEHMAVPWCKSCSGGEGNECVEIAELQAEVRVRDSKVPDGNNLTVSRDAFTAFPRRLADEDGKTL